MSTKSKKVAKEKRLRKKRVIRAINAAKYEDWRKSGTNSKSGRSGKRKILNRAMFGIHPRINCGNIGCKRCFPQYNMNTRIETFIIAPAP